MKRISYSIPSSIERIFSREILLDHFCEEFHSNIHHIFSYSHEDGNEYIHKNIDENDIFSIATFEENFQVIVNGNIYDCVTDNALDLALYVPSILNLDEEDGRSREEEDDLLTVVNFPNFVL